MIVSYKKDHRFGEKTFIVYTKKKKHFLKNYSSKIVDLRIVTSLIVILTLARLANKQSIVLDLPGVAIPSKVLAA